MKYMAVANSGDAKYYSQTLINYKNGRKIGVWNLIQTSVRLSTSLAAETHAEIAITCME